MRGLTKSISNSAAKLVMFSAIAWLFYWRPLLNLEDVYFTFRRWAGVRSYPLLIIVIGVFIVLLIDVFRKAILPLYELYRHGKIVKTYARINSQWYNKMPFYYLFRNYTYMKFGDEKEAYTFIGVLPEDIADHRVEISFLRRSRLVLDIKIVDEQ